MFSVSYFGPITLLEDAGCPKCRTNSGIKFDCIFSEDVTFMCCVTVQVMTMAQAQQLLSSTGQQIMVSTKNCLTHDYRHLLTTIVHTYRQPSRSKCLMELIKQYSWQDRGFRISKDCSSCPYQPCRLELNRCVCFCSLRVSYTILSVGSGKRRPADCHSTAAAGSNTADE